MCVLEQKRERERERQNTKAQVPIPLNGCSSMKGRRKRGGKDGRKSGCVPVLFSP